MIILINAKRVDPMTRSFLAREQLRRDKYARRTRTVQYKKQAAQRLKAMRIRSEEAKKIAKAKKEVRYKSLSDKLVKVPKQRVQKKQRTRTTLAELAARYESGDPSVKYCEKGCGKYYITAHKCKL
jgi:hypothetical protein